MKQLLINIDDEGVLSVYEVDATVATGMGVMLSEMRTHRLLSPIQLKLQPLYTGEHFTEALRAIELFRDHHLETVNDPIPTRIPWKDW